MTFEQAEKWEFNPFDLTKVHAYLLTGRVHTHTHTHNNIYCTDYYIIIYILY